MKNVLVYDGGAGTVMVQAPEDSPVAVLTTGLVDAVNRGMARILGVADQEPTAAKIAAAYAGEGVAVRVTPPKGEGQTVTPSFVPSNGSLIALGRENIGGVTR